MSTQTMLVTVAAGGDLAERRIHPLPLVARPLLGEAVPGRRPHLESRRPRLRRVSEEIEIERDLTGHRVEDRDGRDPLVLAQRNVEVAADRPPPRRLVS